MMRKVSILFISIAIIVISFLGFNYCKQEVFQVGKNTVKIYFLKDTETSNTTPVAVKRRVNPGQSIARTAIEELLKGPGEKEKGKGFYTEIPSETRLLGLEETDNRVVINLSEDFEYGGGADSMFARINQLVKTSVNAAGGKPVYLDIEGKRAEVIGGEGVIVEQPLAEKQDSEKK